MLALKRIWQLVRRPTGFVGKDLEGNRFYEYPSLFDDPRRTRRRVKYKAYEDVWLYVSGSRRIPVQWTAWLTHTRQHPPSLEELRADVERQRRILAKVSVIEARDREERAQGLAAPSDQSVVDNSSEYHSSAQVEDLKPTPQDATPSTAQHPPTHPVPDKIPDKTSGTGSAELPVRDQGWQPEAWTPKAMHKRGG